MSTIPQLLAEWNKKQELKAQRVAARSDLEFILNSQKKNASPAAFKNTKVMSCKSIFTRNGSNICRGFTDGAVKPIDLSRNKSFETKSVTSDHY